MPVTKNKPPLLRSLEFVLGIIFDARRAVYLPGEKLLAVADLHLGYAWAHRAQGQLLPVACRDNALSRLDELVREYAPEKVVLVGDIVHRAHPSPALLDELRALFALAKGRSELILLAGNHDRKLQELLESIDAPSALHREFTAGENLFLHGDCAPCQGAKRCIIGHEHPAISLGDGVATSRKFPCFLVADDLIALPSFSSWSAHTPFGAYEFMSPLARQARFHTAVAILGERLLPTPLSGFP